MDDLRDTSDAKRKRLTHKQTWEPRKDHDDIVERDARKRFKQTEKQITQFFFSHSISSCKNRVKHFERSASAAHTAQKARTSLDADMEISANETLSDAMLNADMALHSGNKTLHWTNSESDIECEAVAKSIRTQESE